MKMFGQPGVNQRLFFGGVFWPLLTKKGVPTDFYHIVIGQILDHQHAIIDVI